MPFNMAVTTRASSRKSNDTEIELRTYQSPAEDIERQSNGSKPDSHVERNTSTGSNSKNGAEHIPSSYGTDVTVAQQSPSIPPSIQRAHSLGGDSTSNIDAESASPPASPSIPPPDQGRTAWLILAGSALLQAPVWGTSRLYYPPPAHLQ